MKMAIYIFLCTLAGVAFCVRSHSAEPRVTVAALEYMREHYYNPPNKTEMTNGLEPTDVWCFSDKDVVRQSYRPTHQLQISPKCSTLTHFIFQWHILAEALSHKLIRLDRVYLRTYLKVDQRYASDNEKITLTSTMSIYNASSDDISGNMRPGDANVAQQSQELTLVQTSDQWVEIELTEAATKLWSQIQHSTEVKVTIAATVDCTSRTNPPISIINPAEIPLDHTELRERALNSSQPFLLVLATDDTIKGTSRVKTHTTKAINRGKRQTDETCRRHNYNVNFHQYGFTNVSVPISLDLGKCAGSCSETTLRQDSSLGTNHAKMMSSIQNIQLFEANSPVTSSGPATSACCVPASYEPRTTLFMVDNITGSLHVHYFNDLVVKTCSCQ